MLTRIGFTIFATVLFLTNTGNSQTPPAAPAPAPVAGAANSGTPGIFGQKDSVGDYMIAECEKKGGTSIEKMGCVSRRGADQCPGLIASMNSARNRMSEGCGSSDAAACITRAEECAEMDSEEGSTSLTNTMNGVSGALGISNGATMPSSQYRGKCMSSTEHKDEKKSIEDKIKEARKKASDLETDITKAREKAEADKREVEEALLELNTKSKNEDLEVNAKERESTEQSQTENATASQKIRQLEIEALTAQSTLANQLGQRATALAKLAPTMIKKDCIEALEKTKASKKTILSGSAGNALRDKSESRSRLRADYDLCMKERKILRDTTIEDFKNKISAMEQGIADKKTESKTLKEMIELRARNAGTAKAERTQAKEQTKQERQTKAQLLNKKYQTVAAAAEAKVAQFQKELNQTQLELNKASNELGTLGSRPSGKQTPQSAQGAADEYQSFHKQCVEAGCSACATGTTSGGNPAAPRRGTN